MRKYNGLRPCGNWSLGSGESLRPIISQVIKLKSSNMSFLQRFEIPMASDPARIDRWTQGSRLDIFLAKRLSLNLRKKIFFAKVWNCNDLGPGGNWSLGPGESFEPIFSQALKLKPSKNIFFAKVWNYNGLGLRGKLWLGLGQSFGAIFSQALKLKSSKIFFSAKVWNKNGLRPRGNWSLGPVESFGPIFSQALKLKSSKKSFFWKGVKWQWPRTPAGIDGWAQGSRLYLFLAQP